MKKSMTFLFLFFAMQYSYAQENICIGKRYTIYSDVLQENREYLVYTPASYESAGHEDVRYPVIYLIDAELYFHAMTAVLNTYTRGRQPVMPECIMVGIVNTDRTRDLTPTASAYGRNGQLRADGIVTGGGGDNFYTFITGELRDAIDTSYRTSGENILFGHSYGGLFTVNTLTHHTGSFDRYIALDPSLWWDNSRLAGEAKELYGAGRFDGKRLYIGVATKPRSGRQSAFSGTMREFLGTTAVKAQNNGLVFHWKEFPEETHGTLPIPGMLEAFKVIFE